MDNIKLVLYFLFGVLGGVICWLWVFWFVVFLSGSLWIVDIENDILLMIVVVWVKYLWNCKILIMLLFGIELEN